MEIDCHCPLQKPVASAPDRLVNAFRPLLQGIVAGNVEPVTFRLWWPGDFTLRDTVGWINVPIFDKCWQPGSCAYNWRVDAGDELLRIGLWQGVHTSYAIVYVDAGARL